MTRLLLATLFGLGLASMAARGEDAPPVLTEVRLDDQRVIAIAPGHVIVAHGSRLHACPLLPEPRPGERPPRNTCRHDELEVRLGGRKCMLIASDEDRVVLVVPQDMPLGRHALEVTIRGRGTATLDLDVLAHVPHVYRPGRGCALVATPPPPHELYVSRFELVTSPEGLRRFILEGGLPGLPDGCSVEALLFHDEGVAPIAARRLPLEEDRFRTEFEAPPRPLPLGTYRAEVVLELARQPRREASELARTLPPAAVKRLEWVDLGASV
ncbi:MAG: hypothetical protein KIT58_14800 [Planctomycetota bacterium]|nr:hypothetical protein [Planctomycetota bacterium]